MDKPIVQDIFHHFYPAYLDQYSPSPVQAKVAHNIMNCKTVPMVQMYVYVRIVASYRFITIPAVTVAAPCVRLFRKKCGWMHAERMSLMLLISIWFLRFLIF